MARGKTSDLAAHLVAHGALCDCGFFRRAFRGNGFAHDSRIRGSIASARLRGGLPATANLTPDWIANLLRPAYREKFDFVAPLYSSHKLHGLLARNLLYPMSRAVFGCQDSRTLLG